MVKLTIDITSKCNLSCEFCYNSEGESSLTLEDMAEIESKYPSAHLFEIGGGEPLLHKDIIPITEYLAEKGKTVNIVTNGTVLNKDFLKLAEKYASQLEIEVSLHASNPQLFKEITGKNMFDKVIENIYEYKKHFTTIITTAVYEKNFDDVKNILLLRRKLDVPIRVSLIFPSGKGKNVRLISQDKIKKLTDILMAEKIFSGNDIMPTLMYADSSCSSFKSNNCEALTKYYGFKKEGKCPAEAGEKVYISPAKCYKTCEFLEEEN